MRYAFVAVSSLYGVDILEDNAEECRERLYGIVEAEAKRAIKNRMRYSSKRSVTCCIRTSCAATPSPSRIPTATPSPF